MTAEKKIKKYFISWTLKETETCQISIENNVKTFKFYLLIIKGILIFYKKKTPIEKLAFINLHKIF